MEKKYNRGLVALSADPITYGHLDLVAKALEVCDEVVVLIADNDQKKGSYLFSLSEREVIAKKALALQGLDNVKVIASNGLLVDVYLREDCDAVFRGIRDETDLRFETSMMWMHTQILPGLNVEYVSARKDLQQVSSTMVKAFVSHHLDVSRFVPVFVQQLLEERICNQYKLAITGEMASGKSYVAKQLKNFLEAEHGLAVHILNIDELVKQVYAEQSPAGKKVRGELERLFGPEVLTADKLNVNTSALSAKLFASDCPKQTREFVNNLTAPHVERKYREALAGKKGLILFEWAMLAEMNMGHWANYNCLVVESDCREQLAAMRGLSLDKLRTVSCCQWNSQHKIRVLAQASEHAGSGSIVVFTNDKERPEDLNLLAAEVLRIFPGLKAKEVSHADRAV